MFFWSNRDTFYPIVNEERKTIRVAAVYRRKRGAPPKTAGARVLAHRLMDLCNQCHGVFFGARVPGFTFHSLEGFCLCN